MHNIVWRRSKNLDIYKAIIRSHIDFTTHIIFNASKKIKYSLEICQRKAVRIIMGCMKSTLVPALLSEAGVTTCQHRRIWLGTKVILKKLGIKKHLSYF